MQSERSIRQRDYQTSRDQLLLGLGTLRQQIAVLTSPSRVSSFARAIKVTWSLNAASTNRGLPMPRVLIGHREIRSSVLRHLQPPFLVEFGAF